MMNYLLPILIVVLSFSVKPMLQNANNNPNTKQNNIITNSSVSSIQTEPKKNNNINKPSENHISTPRNIVKKEDPKPTEPIIPTITPTPFATPTIHIQEPPDGFTVSITPTPTVYYDGEIQYDPLPTRNPCYCDPRKEKLCLDVYSC